MRDDKLASGFTCKCGIKHSYPLYVYAHWDTSLIFTCTCGARYDILRGKARELPTQITASQQAK